MSFFSIDKISDVSTFDVDTSGALQINSSAGAISIGNDDIDQAINIGTQGERTISIGTGSFADTVAIGNSTGATAVTITSGTGDIIASSSDAVTIDATGVLELNSSGGVISIGGDDVDRNINIGTQGERTISIGTGAFADTVAIGNATGATAVTITSGTGDIIASSTDAVTIDAAGVLELNSSGGAISIGNDAVAQSINIGSGAAARTITIGNSTGATAVNITSGASGDITLDAGGADIFLKDGGTTYGSLTNNSGELLIKSGSTPTPAIECSGANITTGGTLTLGSTSAVTAGAYSGNAILVSDSGVVKHMTTAEFATEISAVTTSAANTFTDKQQIDLGVATLTPSVDGSHFHIEGGVTMTDNSTSGSGTANVYNQVSIEAITLAATNSSVTTTDAATFYISDAPAAGGNQTLTNAYALYIAAGASQFTGNLISKAFLINTYDTVTYGSNSGDITATSADGTTHDPTASSVFLQAVASSTDTTYHWDLSSFTGGGNGTMLHLVFDKVEDTGITALQVNFNGNGETKRLFSGNGANDYISFTTTGQSASLIYMDSAWRIINTGATIGNH